MAGGRPPQRSKLVERMQGSEQAKERLRAFLDTLSGERTVEEVCGELGINPARFYKLRNRFLQESVEGLEERPPGVKPKYDPEARQEIEELKERVHELEKAVRRSHIREEISLVTTRVASGDVKKGFRGGR